MSHVDRYGQSVEIKKQQLESLDSSVDSATKLCQNAPVEYVDALGPRGLKDAKTVTIETKEQQLTAKGNGTMVT